MTSTSNIRQGFNAAIPIMLGYVAIGIPCGIISESVGMNAFQVFIMSILFYSGAGQFMIPNMYLAGSSIASIIASVSLVNTRQMLYSASLAPFCENASKPLVILFAATVTDESYGVSISKFNEGDWSVDRALAVNLFSESSWAISCALGVLIGNQLEIPLSIASFAMTSIFICLLCSQKITSPNIIAAICAMIGVFVCKVIGLSGAGIIIGALFGVVVALVYISIRKKVRLP